MLSSKDYCDYETCVALKELGFSEPTLAYYHGFLPSKPLLYLVIDEDCMPKDGVNVFDLLSNSNKYKDSKNIDAPTLWEAQKWLREEKGIFLDIGLFNDGVFYYCIRQKENNYWREIYRSFFHDGLFDDHGKFESYEEALSEGIKVAIKILKSN